MTIKTVAAGVCLPTRRMTSVFSFCLSIVVVAVIVYGEHLKFVQEKTEFHEKSAHILGQ